MNKKEKISKEDFSALVYETFCEVFQNLNHDKVLLVLSSSKLEENVIVRPSDYTDKFFLKTNKFIKNVINLPSDYMTDSEILENLRIKRKTDKFIVGKDLFSIGSISLRKHVNEVDTITLSYYKTYKLKSNNFLLGPYNTRFEETFLKLIKDTSTTNSIKKLHKLIKKYRENKNIYKLIDFYFKFTKLYDFKLLSDNLDNNEYSLHILKKEKVVRDEINRIEMERSGKINKLSSYKYNLLYKKL